MADTEKVTDTESMADTKKDTDIKPVTDRKIVEPLFADMNDTIIQSCLENVQGAIYAKDSRNPDAAMALLGDFCFFAGRADRDLVKFKPEGRPGEFILMIPPDEEWAGLIEEIYGEHARRVKRYAIKKEEHVWDLEYLQTVVESLPEGYTVQMIGKESFCYARNHEWARDLVSRFADYDTYREHGIGVVVLRDGVPVSGASSYSFYSKGIEIEIDTHPDYRRQGLAFVCGAKLILECEKRGLYPGWDAQNLWSLALAEKLGYHFDREYVTCEVTDYRER